MTRRDLLVEQHIRSHESHLQHIDELFVKAQEILPTDETTSAEAMQLTELRRQRDELAKHVKELKKKSREQWQVEGIEQAGPMILWETLATKLQNLVEGRSTTH